jgi:hypothetical protein
VNLFRLTIFVALACAGVAEAAPITYFYSGSGTGSLGGAGFTNAEFVITAQAETSNITPWVNAGFGPQNTHLSATININGLGVHTINTPSHSWTVPDGSVGGLGENLYVNWVTLSGSFLPGYGLDTAYGPVTDTTPWDVGQFNTVNTTGGVLSFTSISTVTFEAKLVPEQSAMLSAAIAGLAGCCWIRNGVRNRFNS